MLNHIFYVCFLNEERNYVFFFGRRQKKTKNHFKWLMMIFLIKAKWIKPQMTYVRRKQEKEFLFFSYFIFSVLIVISNSCSKESVLCRWTWAEKMYEILRSPWTSQRYLRWIGMCMQLERSSQALYRVSWTSARLKLLIFVLRNFHLFNIKPWFKNKYLHEALLLQQKKWYHYLNQHFFIDISKAD